MGTVFLLHFVSPVNPTHPARHYLEYTARTVETRVNDHRSGFEYRTVPIMWAAHQRNIGFDVARVWPNATKADEKRLRDCNNNPRLCPICTPSLALTTTEYTRTSAPHDFTGEVYFYRFWRTRGDKNAYGNLASLRDRMPRKSPPRTRKDGTHNYVDTDIANHMKEGVRPVLSTYGSRPDQEYGEIFDYAAVPERAVIIDPAHIDRAQAPAYTVREAFIIVNGRRYDIDLIAEDLNALADAANEAASDYDITAD